MASTPIAATTDAPELGSANVADFVETARKPATWMRFAGPAFAIALLATVAWTLGSSDLHEAWHLLPFRPGFWWLLAFYLAIQPMCDFLIFRRLWNLPFSGLSALFRKNASNEILLGYLGEVQFYAWARQNAKLAGSPFGAVKDVAVLSAIVGNLVTLVLVVACWPYLADLPLGRSAGPLFWSIAIVLGTSLAIALFRNRIFSLPIKQRWEVAGIHLARTIVMGVVLALMWHKVLPQIAPQWWLLMAAGRLLITRLPFLPNKDLLFASLAAMLSISAPDVSSVILLTSALLFFGQVAIGSGLAISELVGFGRRGTQNS